LRVHHWGAPQLNRGRRGPGRGIRKSREVANAKKTAASKGKTGDSAWKEEERGPPPLVSNQSTRAAHHLTHPIKKKKKRKKGTERRYEKGRLTKTTARGGFQEGGGDPAYG